MPANVRLPLLRALAVLGAVVGTMLALAGPAGATSPNVVISQVYGGGGNSGAPYQNDFVELYNHSTSPIPLTGWSVQYASATGTGNFSANPVATLSGVLQPGQYYLVQEGAGAGNGVPLPVPDASSTAAMAAGAGKVILANTTTGLACNGGSTPCSGAQLGQIVDLVGYGAANFFEGAGPAPTLSNSTSGSRADSGCTDTDNNAADFSAGGVSPRNTLSPVHFCSSSDDPPSVSSTIPANSATGVAVDATVSLLFSEPVNVTGSWYSIACGTSGPHTAVATGGPSMTFTLDPDTNFANGETCTVTIVAADVTDEDTADPPDTMAADYTFSFTTVAAPQVAVSQVYGGGGNTGAVYKNDFIEVFNRGTSAVSLNGWSVQYASSAGTTWTPTNLGNVTLQPGQYYLVQEGAGAGNGVDLPPPDASGTIAMSAASGKVVLAKTTTAFGVSCPSGATVADLVGYGTANCFEGSGAAGGLANATAAVRKNGGCVDTDDNAADFTVETPAARNTGSAFRDCSADTAPSVASTNPADDAAGVPVGANVSVTFSEPVNVTGSWYSISCASSGAHTATVSGGPTTFTLDPSSDFVQGETCTVTIVAADVSDQDTNDPPDTMAADYVFSFVTETAATPIHTIQGATHISPLNGQVVRTLGIVTARSSNGFWVQDPSPDADDATSEGIFVFTSSAPAVSVGDSVSVTGRVQEFRPGGVSNGNLTTTELASPSTSVLSSGNPLPAPVVMGAGGRIPPDTVIEDDAVGGNVENPGSVFDPNQDGLDYYESLEGMRVQLNNAVAVGPTATSFGETPVVGDDGANASVRTYRGGLLLRPGDGNPERVTLDDLLTAVPNVNVGDHFSGPVVGIMDYNFGNPFVEVTSAGLTRIADGVQREVTDPVSPGQLAVSTFNFENLAATDPQSKFDSLASLIVNNLRSPDLLAGEEVQDNNGTVDNGVVDATQTLTRLATAISAAGGPTYAWRQIDPVNDEDGGAPGGNIRQAILFRTDRGLSFVDRPGGDSTTPNGVTGSGAATRLLFSPGRIAPGDSAWSDSRKPLAAELDYHGHHLFVVVNHFNSKGGDDPLRGRFQPPVEVTATQRHQQATLVANFVSQISAAEPSANVVVLGDLNDFEFSQTVQILEGAGLHDLMNTLPLNQRYSYEFEGNAQVLDHIMFSSPLFSRSLIFDPVHVNAEFFDQASDHDPSVVRVALNDAPSVSAGGPYTVDEGSSITLSASGSDPEGDSLTYAWDLDDNGSFETPGQSVSFSAPDGPRTPTVRVRATDSAGNTATASTTVTVNNVAPTATFSAPSSDFAGFPFTLSLTGAFDPSPADTAEGLTFAFDCGSGYGAFTFASSASCPTDDVGTRSVGAKVRDKDGGASEYRGSVEVTVTFDSLCALTRSYSRKESVANTLCNKLERAEAATTANARNAKLQAYRDEVDAKTGTAKDKAFNLEQAETLKRLSTRLGAAEVSRPRGAVRAASRSLRVLNRP